MSETLTILLVEDNPGNSTLAIYLLEHAGYRVVSAASSEEAITALQTVHPDIILCDISLPGENGHSLLKKIKENPQFKNVCAIAVSAYAREEDKYRCLETGYDAFIEKPIDITTFVEHVSAVHKRKIANEKISQYD